MNPGGGREQAGVTNRGWGPHKAGAAPQNSWAAISPLSTTRRVKGCNDDLRRHTTATGDRQSDSEGNSIKDGDDNNNDNDDGSGWR